MKKEAKAVVGAPAKKRKKKKVDATKGQRFDIDIPVWDSKLVLFFGGKIEYAESQVPGILDCSEVVHEEGIQACVFRYEPVSWVVMWLPSKVEPSVIVHEALHAVFHIMRSKLRSPAVPENEEAFCYLLDYVCKQLFSICGIK